MGPSRTGPAGLAMLLLVACAPALDWRESRPPGSGVTMLFPCGPDRHERAVGIAGQQLVMQMDSCSAAGATFSLAFIDAPQVDRVAPLLDALRVSAAQNIAGAAEPKPFQPPGATPNERAGLLRIAGRLPDGRDVVEHAAFFVRGTRIYQATAIGAAVSADAVETFFGAIRVVP